MANTNSIATRRTSYNYSLGVPTQVIDENGAVTTWKHDTIGRVIRETNPDNTFTVIDYLGCFSPPCWASNLHMTTQSRVFRADGTWTGAGKHVFTDGLDRVRFSESYHLNGRLVRDEAITYDALGRVSTRSRPSSAASSGYQAFTYDLKDRVTAARLYQNDNVTLDRQTVTTFLGRTTRATNGRGFVVERATDAMDRLRRVIEPSPGGSTVLRQNGFSTTFSCGPEHQVYRQVATYANGTETTTHVVGNLERVFPAGGGGELWRHHVPLLRGSELVVVFSSAGTSTQALLADHLGSTQNVVSLDTGASLAEASFFPFGARRSAALWAGAPFAAEMNAFASTTRNGFTGHVQLDNVGFIHMKGRAYDPHIGRFMTVDVAAKPATPQSLNPFSYVENHPLSGIDPNGYMESPGAQPSIDFNVVNVVDSFESTGGATTVLFFDDGFSCINPTNDYRGAGSVPEMRPLTREEYQRSVTALPPIFEAARSG